MGIAARYFDTELGRWAHTEWRPGPADSLAWAVERVWDFEGMAAHPQERVFPSGQLELIVQLDDRYLDVLPDGVHPTPVACVTGIQCRPIVVRAPRRPVRVLAVRMHPIGAWATLGHPLYELTDRTADLDDLLGRAAAEVAERCAGVGSGIERVRLMVAWLRRRLLADAAFRADPGALHVAARIAHTEGRASIASLGGETSLSGGRLASLFRQQVGVTPKRLARIHRFHHALRLLTDRGAPLVRVAAEAGYYDQPHMNAEFRALARLTPRQLLSATRYPSSTSLAEST
jgi:AraC-like DNA-binding protein